MTAEHDGAIARGGNQTIPRPARWSPGDPPPWAGRVLDVLADHAAVVTALRAAQAEGRTGDVTGGGSDDGRSAQQPTVPPTASPSHRSAVLVPIIRHDGLPSLVLTRRSLVLSRHRGEIAFPGGRIDDGESPVEAALREAHEEIGLAPEMVEPIGELAPLFTQARRDHITPVVGAVSSAATFAPASIEVDRVLVVPLVELVRSDTFRREWWEFGDRRADIHFYELDGETLWGATARLVSRLIGIVTT